jgi:hypothetical protein
MKNKSNTNTTSNELDVDVLYQKLGDKWFAFSLIGDEVFMAPISEDMLEEIRTENHSRGSFHNEAV